MLWLLYRRKAESCQRHKFFQQGCICKIYRVVWWTQKSIWADGQWTSYNSKFDRNTEAAKNYQYFWQTARGNGKVTACNFVYIYIYNYIEILNDLCHKRYIEQLDYLIQSCLLYLYIYIMLIFKITSMPMNVWNDSV